MKFRLKALLTLALAVGLAASGFSETLVKESGLAKELEKNTDDKAVFVCEMNLKKISIKDFWSCRSSAAGKIQGKDCCRNGHGIYCAKNCRDKEIKIHCNL